MARVVMNQRKVRESGEHFLKAKAKVLDALGPGNHSDGENLFLRVTRGPGRVLHRSWIFRYSSPVYFKRDQDGELILSPDRTKPDRDGKLIVVKGKPIPLRRDLGIGPLRAVSLEAARSKAAKYHRWIGEGKDPIDARDEEELEAAKTAAEHKRKLLTLRQAVRDYHAIKIEPMRSTKHGLQWLSSIENHVPKKLLDQPIAELCTLDGTRDLLDALLELRTRVPETGRRITQRLGLVFANAKVRGLVPGNPISDIKSELKESARDRAKATKHHNALPFVEVPDLIRSLRAAKGTAAMALEFLILCASRTSEVTDMVWDEVDLAKKIWTIPGSRMKVGEAHRVFLSDRAVEILEAAKAFGGKQYVFPSLADNRQAMSNMAMLATLKRLGYAQRTTTHGLRASFSTWANEQHYPRDVIEITLAHGRESKVEAAYNRAQYVEARRKLLADWAKFILPTKTAKPAKGNVVPLRKAVHA